MRSEFQTRTTDIAIFQAPEVEEQMSHEKRLSLNSSGMPAVIVLLASTFSRCRCDRSQAKSIRDNLSYSLYSFYSHFNVRGDIMRDVFSRDVSSS